MVEGTAGNTGLFVRLHLFVIDTELCKLFFSNVS